MRNTVLRSVFLLFAMVAVSSADEVSTEDKAAYSKGWISIDYSLQSPPALPRPNLRYVGGPARGMYLRVLVDNLDDDFNGGILQKDITSTWQRSSRVWFLPAEGRKMYRLRVSGQIYIEITGVLENPLPMMITYPISGYKDVVLEKGVSSYKVLIPMKWGDVPPIKSLEDIVRMRGPGATIENILRRE